MPSRFGTCVRASLGVALLAGSSRASDPAEWAKQNLDDLIPLYEHLHRHPELSFQEVETSKRIAKELQAVGAEVTTDVGGYGVVGVLKNGSGKRLLIRTDLDGLPIIEETGLPYASNTRVQDPDRTGTVGVMHACGHDVHMTNFVGVARYLSRNRDLWNGTVLFVGQPAEEQLGGAKAMLETGLYERFGKPDYALALHVAADQRVGTIQYGVGFVAAAADWVDIVVRGVGGHAAKPQETIDPIVQAAQLVLAFQTIISRDIDPIEPAVVTVGSIHGGTRHNIIPDECHLQLTLRCYSDEVRKRLHKAIEQRAKGIAESMGAPPPEVRLSEGTDALYNDPDLVGQLLPVFRRAFGEDNVIEGPAEMGSEDFAMFGQGGVPIFMFGLGSAPEERLKAKDGSCSLHSPNFYPDIRPTLAAGITAMGAAALKLLPPENKPPETP